MESKDADPQVFYASDLHLEFGDEGLSVSAEQSQFDDTRPRVLVLAGDVGDPIEEAYWKCIRACAEKYNDVVLVPGNHEYYGRTIEDGSGLLQEGCDGIPNVHLLNNASVLLHGIWFVGSTLWSRITLQRRDALVNDFTCIRRFRIRDYNACHLEAVQFLAGELARLEEMKQRVIVCTHHLPSWRVVHSKYRGHKATQCFASHCDFLLSRHTPGFLKGWIYGHTHFESKQLLHGSVRTVCNPLGYPGERPSGTTFGPALLC